ncbi:TIGR02466 family protein [Pseudomonas mucidolens]|uniref:TIGR02466 family protein n=1 Tax=Pseudomonas mucidolens TaxID=46679 RepID=UPI0030D91D67
MINPPGINLLTHLLPHLACEAQLPIVEADRETMSQAVWRLHETNRDGRSVSNRGAGWQAEIVDRTPFVPVMSAIEQVARGLLGSYGLTFQELVFTTMWANINFHRDFNVTHRHGGHLSGVYFLEVADGCGDLVLGSTAAFYISNPLVKKARDAEGNNFLGHSIKPRRGQMVLFSSETNHHVDCNLSERPRLSIAWNMRVDDGADGLAART